MKLIIPILSLMFLVGCYRPENPTPIAERTNEYVPVDLEDCFIELDRLLSKEDRDNLPPVDALHFGLGMGLRNRWGLWSESRLATYFNHIGIYHPDDMSSIILTSYQRYLVDEPIQLQSQVQYFEAYWKKVDEREVEIQVIEPPEDSESTDQIQSNQTLHPTPHLRRVVG